MDCDSARRVKLTASRLDRFSSIGLGGKRQQSFPSGAQIERLEAAVRSLPPLTAIDRSGTGRSRDRESVSQQARIEFEAAIADLANPNSDADLWSTLRAQVEILDFEAGLDRGATLVHLWHA
jgi:hypothetical protein